MPSRGRDRLVVAGAVTVVLATAGVVLGTVVQAERAGTKALEDLQVAQVEQLARSLDNRISSTYTFLKSFVDAPPAWNARLRDPADAKKMAGLQALNPSARTGFLVVDSNGIVTNGTLLRDPSQVGRKLDRPDVDVVLAGKPWILPVGPGATTALPSVFIGQPLTNAAGRTYGAILFESEVSTESQFNAEVAGLRRGRTGEFSFLDGQDTVHASSNPELLGNKLDEPLIERSGDGFHRGDDKVAVIREIPSAGWRIVFRQDAEEFEGALTGPLQTALLFVVALGVLAAGLALVLLSRRLRRAREEQRRLQEISEVREEFISIVSHELRTPVAGLLGFLQTTIDHWDTMADDERKRTIGRSLASARRLHSLTRDVLDTSAMESGLLYSFALLDLRSEIASAVAATQELAPDRVVTLTLPDDPAMARVDAERIQQVMTNLLDNAYKSAPPDSPVEVTVAVDHGQACVSVADHGPGLSASDLGRVFDKFVRGRSSTTSGTGLGLYICRQIVEAHGGTIRAESTPGGGATLVFEIALASTSAEETVDA